LWRLCQELAELVLEAGGRFYYAKDAILLASSFARVHGDAAVARSARRSRSGTLGTSCRPTCRGVSDSDRSRIRSLSSTKRRSSLRAATTADDLLA
jgi:hypothetical protein